MHIFSDKKEFHISLKNFIKYIHKFKFNDQIGIKDNPCNCPIANYLNNTFKTGKSYKVHQDIIEVNDSIYFADDWVCEFIEKVDELPNNRKSISAIEAYNVLVELGYI